MLLGNTTLIPVHPDLAPQTITGAVRSIIEAAGAKLPGESFDVDTLRASCTAAKRQLWLAKKGEDVIGVGVTGIYVEPDDTRTLELLLTAGRDWPSWAWMLAPIEAWGSRQGCLKVRICGRAGWRRRLRDYEVIEPHGDRGFVFEKALTDG